MIAAVLALLAWAPSAHADVLVKGYGGVATLYYKKGATAFVSDCASEARASCQLHTQRLGVELFTNEYMNISPAPFYTQELILPEAEVKKLTDEIRLGANTMDKEQLFALKIKLRNHEIESQKKFEFEVNRRDLLAAILDETSLQIQDFVSFGADFLEGLRIDYASYRLVSCGTAGALDARIASCAKYAATPDPDLALVMRNAGDIVSRNNEIWYRISTKTFFHAGPELVSPSYLKEFTGALWRETTTDELNALNGAFGFARVLIAAAPVNLDGIQPYQAVITNRRTKEKLVFDYSGGVLTFRTQDGQVLNAVSLIHDPRKTEFIQTDELMNVGQSVWTQLFPTDEMRAQWAMVSALSGQSVKVNAAVFVILVDRVSAFKR